MVTIHREYGLRFVIYVDDHDPAHIHAIGNGEAKIVISAKAEIIWSHNFTASDLSKAQKTVKANWDMFMKRWEDIHG